MGVNVTLTIDETTLARIDEVAHRTDRSREHVAQEALAIFAETEAEHVAAIREGLAQAERGEFASPEEVMRVLTKYRG
ncbi:MAG TPA: CopG family transcriptional regulator [Salinarimonas sp.]|nr:CopG family transcriptional regulator [Salinarimonas sp.]